MCALFAHDVCVCVCVCVCIPLSEQICPCVHLQEPKLLSAWTLLHLSADWFALCDVTPEPLLCAGSHVLLCTQEARHACICALEMIAHVGDKAVIQAMLG
jgi:hypothetical protein